MNTVVFTRQRKSGGGKYDRNRASRYDTRSSTERSRIPGATLSPVTGIEKKRATVERIGSSSSPRWKPTTASGRTSWSLRYLSTSA